ncbi:MAG: CHAT domain-containing protein [Pseudomonadota bacterium]
MRFIHGLLLGALLLATSAHAQNDDEAGAGFRRITLDEARQLRGVLAQPVPDNVTAAALRSHFQEKDMAARRLNNTVEYEAFLRQWIAALPDDPVPRGNFAALLRDQSRFNEAIEQRMLAIGLTSSPSLNAFYRVMLVFEYFRAGRHAEAQKNLDEAVANIETLAASRTWTLSHRLYFSRARSEAYRAQSLLYDRVGRWNEAVKAATDGEATTRQSMKLVLELPSTPANQRERYFVGGDVGEALARKTYALRSGGRLGEAEASLQAYLRLSREVALPPGFLSGIYVTASDLRFSQREFVQAEVYARRSDKALEAMGYDSLAVNRVGRARTLIIALQGQKRWTDSLAEFERLDALAGTDETLRRRVLLQPERALTYVWTGKAAQAAKIYEDLADFIRRTFGEGHFFVTQATGMQGVALWRAGTFEARARALALLKQAINGYTAPRNADFLENIGYRKEVRELVFATYLEAMSSTPGEDMTQALGPADWVRGGVVQQALADAAVRSAASEPALADLVRREQDAKNEVTGLRNYLARETGAAASPLPEIAAGIRARITQLEAARQGLQSQLRSQFVNYDRLVRPLPPSGADIAKALSLDEALLMFLPTDNAVYVWAVTADRPTAFARVALPQAGLAQLVRKARSTLDFAEMRSGMRAFDSDASSELYRRLLQPVQSAFQGKKRLVIAAGGALSQLPFGVLLTGSAKLASPADYAAAPWLIKQAAITQVPSVSAWLAGKQLAGAKPAPELLMGWGDPQFVADAATGQAGQMGSSGATRNVLLTRAATLADPDSDKVMSQGALRYGDIPPLPETRGELVAIAASLKADAGRDLRLGGQATRASVLQSNLSGELQRKKVLVFATHGLMAGDLPNLNQPALALAATASDTQDPLAPLLTLADVLGLKLNADWVVLSACNTAAADGKAEEALSGLARGFFYAGTRSLLVTHWAVESESARQLTTATFAHYSQNPQAPKAESLRQAMLAVMARPEYSHPAFWAPYALVGDGGR